jgi:hypothetical protein
MQHRKSLVALAATFVVATAGWIGLRYEGAGGAMTQAGQHFVAALSADQKAKATMPFDDPRRLDWHFIPKAERKGLQVKEMNESVRKLAHGLLHSGLSEVGYEKATTIMALEAILHELEKSRKGAPIRDPDRYYFTIFGEPSLTSKWGWSVEGHHLSLNFVVDKGKLVAATPAFFGANPALVRSEVGVGPKKDTRTLAKEELLAFELVASLTADQKKVVWLDEKAPSDIRGPVGTQAPNAPPAGLAAEKMSDAQRQTLWGIIESYAASMPKEVGDAWLGEIKRAGTGKIHFGWSGADKPGVGHYYRVQGPTFLIEFVNVQADSAGNPANHIHSVWRSLAGDFGIPI